MVLKQIDGTNLIVVAAVNIDTYFMPVHDQLETEAQKHIEQIDRKFDDTTHRLKRRLYLIAGVVDILILLVALGFGIWFSHSISKPVKRLRDRVDQMSRGDLTTDFIPRGSTETTPARYPPSTR